MPDLGRSLVHALRRLRRAPVFSLPAIVTLALGIGSCSLMFSILETVLLKPLAFRDPGRVVMIWGDIPQANLGFSEQPIHGRQYKLMRENMAPSRPSPPSAPGRSTWVTARRRSGSTGSRPRAGSSRRSA